jgi:subtilisin family serine protease
MIQNLDQNGNGISDQFELKLNSLEKSNSSVISLNNIKSLTNEKAIDDGSSNIKQKIEAISYNDINFIIQFPDYYNYTTSTLIFEENKGIIKHTYKEAINGFAGKLNYDEFIQFCEQLKQNNIPFFIEEDGIIEATLYYASRNMNLRPYVWDTLGYTGDNQSSIAILDTGIDDSHEFFDNFSFPMGDFSYKIVAWDDEVNIISPTPSDDNGHGSHCAGIAAGMGTPVVDGLERSVATESFVEDFYPYIFADGYSVWWTLTRFNVTQPGDIEVECNFTDFTIGPDRIYGKAALYYRDAQVDIIGDNSIDWYRNLSATVTSTTLGPYELRVQVTFDDIDVDGDNWVWDPIIRFRGEIHWPFNPPSYGSGNLWQGVAPNTHLVGVKVLDQDGIGWDADIIAGINWVINSRKTYNITVMSLSLGGSSEHTAMINAVNKAVENGIVTIVAAGNDGADGNNIGSPGDADKVITVAAMNYKDQITEYSSQGGSDYYQNTTKPDIVSPGGSINDLNMFSADTNDNDAAGNFTVEFYNDELMPAQGTSMATPAVAGAASLLVQAMGGGNNWDWDSGLKSKQVKAMLLMTATETYPLRREDDKDCSPLLNRGGKDVHEGYGRLNIDAAIEAWTNELIPSGTIFNITPLLNSSRYNPFSKHASASYVILTQGVEYTFNLTVPAGLDYDLHLYNYTPTVYGEPVMVAYSTSSQLGKDEIMNVTVSHDGIFFLVAKAVGLPYPSGDDGDDDDDAAEKFDLIEFLTSPLGLIIICVSIVALIAIVVLIKKSTSKKDDYWG